jgi:hypothetical protein
MVDNNVVTQVADQYNGSLGVFAGYTDHTVITHNKDYDLPYSGISVGWDWGLTDKCGDSNYPGNSGVPVWDTATTSRDNVVSDNRISDIMKSQADGGAIYTLSANPGGIMSGSYIKDVPPLAYGAIYQDEAAVTGTPPATPCATWPTSGCCSTTAWTSRPTATSPPRRRTAHSSTALTTPWRTAPPSTAATSYPHPL